MFGHSKLLDKLKIRILVLSLQEFRIVRGQGVDLGRRCGAKMQRNPEPSLVLDNEVVLEGCSVKWSASLLVVARPCTR